MIGKMDLGIGKMLLSAADALLPAARIRGIDMLMNMVGNPPADMARMRLKDMYFGATHPAYTGAFKPQRKHWTPQKIQHNAGVSAAEAYMHRKNMSPAKASTLKKTARAYRIAGKALSK